MSTPEYFVFAATNMNFSYRIDFLKQFWASEKQEMLFFQKQFFLTISNYLYETA